MDYTFIKAIESSNIRAYFTKRTPNMGGSISGAKCIPITNPPTEKVGMRKRKNTEKRILYALRDSVFI